MKKFGSIPRKRKTAIKAEVGFECKCPVCLGQVPGEEKTLKKLIELNSKLNPTPSDWKKEAGLRSRIVDLTMELTIGHPLEKITALDNLVGFAYLARDKDLVKKAMDRVKKLREENKVKSIQRIFEKWVTIFTVGSEEFSSNKAPEKEEIDFILSTVLNSPIQLRSINGQ